MKLVHIFGPELSAQIEETLSNRDFNSVERRRILEAVARANKTRLARHGIVPGVLVETLLAHRDGSIDIPEGVTGGDTQGRHATAPGGPRRSRRR